MNTKALKMIVTGIFFAPWQYIIGPVYYGWLYKNHPYRFSIFNYNGGQNRNRKFKIYGLPGEKVKIGFLFFGGIQIYDSILLDEDGEGVFQTYLGRGGTKFFFLFSNHKNYKGDVDLLALNDKTPPTESAPGWFWQ